MIFWAWQLNWSNSVKDFLRIFWGYPWFGVGHFCTLLGDLGLSQKFISQQWKDSLFEGPGRLVFTNFRFEYRSIMWCRSCQILSARRRISCPCRTQFLKEKKQNNNLHDVYWNGSKLPLRFFFFLRWNIRDNQRHQILPTYTDDTTGIPGWYATKSRKTSMPPPPSWLVSSRWGLTSLVMKTREWRFGSAGFPYEKLLIFEVNQVTFIFEGCNAKLKALWPCS